MEHHANEDNIVTLELLSKPENVAFARQSVAMFASQLDFTIDEIDEIKVAVSEVTSNAIIHGYPRGLGMVRIEARLVSGQLDIVVSDQGDGIADIDWATQPTHTSQPQERMGLGLVFVREYMDELSIESCVGEGTTVRMRKKVRSKSVQHDQHA